MNANEFVDWPAGLPEGERLALVEVVREVLRRRGPLGTHALAEAVSWTRDARVPTYNRAAVWGWLHQCVERAAREVAEPRWHPREESAFVVVSRETLRVARAQLRDVAHDWPQNGLCEPLRTTADRITKVLDDKYNFDSGEVP